MKDATTGRHFTLEITREPRDTEIGHAGFGEGLLEKCLKSGNSLAAYPTARPVLRRGRRGNVSALSNWDGRSPGTAKNIERVRATKVVRV